MTAKKTNSRPVERVRSYKDKESDEGRLLLPAG